MKLYNIASTRKLKSGIASMYWQVMSSNRILDPHRQLEYEELQGLIRHTLDKLPVRRLQIFQMHRMEGKKYAEIASSLSLSIKTVEAEMTKALRTLRNEIDNYILTK